MGNNFLNLKAKKEVSVLKFLYSFLRFCFPLSAAADANFIFSFFYTYMCVLICIGS